MTNDLLGGVDIDKRGTKELPPLSPTTGELSPKTDAVVSVELETVNELQSATAEISEPERFHAISKSTFANKYHRLPRSNADKRNQVELLLCAPEWKKRSDRAIAEHCGVSAPFVGKIRSELTHKGTVNLSSERVDRKGRRIETANIGTKPKKAKSTPWNGSSTKRATLNNTDISYDTQISQKRVARFVPEKLSPTSYPEQTSPGVTGSQSLEKSPTTAALIEKAMPGIDPELLKPSSPEVERAIANGKTASSEQAQAQTATHPAEEDLKAVLETRIIAAEAQITALSHKVGARMIAEIALELCTLEEIREIHADLSPRKNSDKWDSPLCVNCYGCQ